MPGPRRARARPATGRRPRHDSMRSRTLALMSIVYGAAVLTAACVPSGSTDTGLAEPYLSPLDDLVPVPLSTGEKLSVVATTSILADVVGRVGGGGGGGGSPGGRRYRSRLADPDRRRPARL